MEFYAVEEGRGPLAALNASSAFSAGPARLVQKESAFVCQFPVKTAFLEFQMKSAYVALLQHDIRVFSLGNFQKSCA